MCIFYLVFTFLLPQPITLITLISIYVSQGLTFSTKPCTAYLHPSRVAPEHWDHGMHNHHSALCNPGTETRTVPHRQTRLKDILALYFDFFFVFKTGFLYSTIWLLGTEQAVRLGKCIYPLNSLADPILWFFKCLQLKCYRTKVEKWYQLPISVCLDLQISRNTYSLYMDLNTALYFGHVQENNCPSRTLSAQDYINILCISCTAPVCWSLRPKL